MHPSRWRFRLSSLLVAVFLLALLTKYVGTPIWEDYALSLEEKRQKAVLAAMDQPINLPFGKGATLEDVLKWVVSNTKIPEDLRRPGSEHDHIPIYMDPAGLIETGNTMQSRVTIDVKGVPLGIALKQVLEQLGLGFWVEKGLVMITSKEAIDLPLPGATRTDEES